VPRTQSTPLLLIGCCIALLTACGGGNATATPAPPASRAVDGLVAAGIVMRQADPHDRRAVLQLATETGREWVERRRREVAAALDEALERFSPADRTRLLRLLGKLNDELRAAGSKHALRYPALLASR